MLRLHPSHQNILAADIMEVVYKTHNHMSSISDELKQTCRNAHERCTFWASIGECEKNAGYMKSDCRPACQSCGEETMKGRTEEGSNDEFNALLDNGSVRWTGGLYQNLGGTPEEIEMVKKVIYKTRDHMTSLKDSVKKVCKNKHESCTFWASLGECENTEAYMIQQAHCLPACQACDKLDFENRCPLPRNLEETAMYKPGEMNAMFERIANGEFDEYEPKILLTDPYVVTFDNFIKPEEVDALIAHGYTAGFKRSGNVGTLDEFGRAGTSIDNTRTSENAWCEGECKNDTIIKPLIDRMVSSRETAPPLS